MGYRPSSVQLLWLCLSISASFDPFWVLSPLFVYCFQTRILELKSPIKRSLSKLGLYHHPSNAHSWIIRLLLDRPLRTLWWLQPCLVPSHRGSVWIPCLWTVRVTWPRMVASVLKMLPKTDHKWVSRSPCIFNLRSKPLFLVKHALSTHRFNFLYCCNIPYLQVLKGLRAIPQPESLGIPPRIGFLILDFHKPTDFLKHGRADTWEPDLHAFPA